MRILRTRWVLVIALLTLAVVGCGSNTEPAADSVAQQDATPPPDADADGVRDRFDPKPEDPSVTSPDQLIRAQPKPKPKPVAEPEPTPESEPVPDAPAGITVPDVVGMDHQGAQDAMQAAGLYPLRERDATGAGRMLLWDRNWVTVAQNPPAGAVVSEDTVVTLSAKKDGE